MKTNRKTKIWWAYQCSLMLHLLAHHTRRFLIYWGNEAYLDRVRKVCLGWSHLGSRRAPPVPWKCLTSGEGKNSKFGVFDVSFWWIWNVFPQFLSKDLGITHNFSTKDRLLVSSLYRFQLRLLEQPVWYMDMTFFCQSTFWLSLHTNFACYGGEWWEGINNFFTGSLCITWYWRKLLLTLSFLLVCTCGFWITEIHVNLIFSHNVVIYIWFLQIKKICIIFVRK